MKSIIQHISSQLQAVYPADEAEALAWWVAEEMTGLSRSQMLTGCKFTKNFADMQTIIDRLLHFEPIQYIFGHTLWAGLDLKVTPATLIPRPETAELVECVERFDLAEQRLALSKGTQMASPIRVLDIGTGSGCIAIALKKWHPEWEVAGIDISEEAIKVAQENADRNHAEVKFIRADVLSDEIEGICPLGGYDIVVSNPPYICEYEKAEMRPNVIEYEPHTALFVPDSDPLRFYRRIAELKAGKALFFEFNESFPQEMSAMLRERGYTDIQITSDIYGKPRIIQGRVAE